MRIAVIFPPQFDPRQPVLGLAVLAKSALVNGAKVKVWDLNLELYRLLLYACDTPKKVERKRDYYLSPECLTDVKQFADLSFSLEEHIRCQYDRSDTEQLYWDDLISNYSEDSSTDWISAVATPSRIPFIKKLYRLFKEIEIWRPDIILISALADTQIIGSLAVASHLKRCISTCRFFFGGPAFACRSELYSNVPWLFDIVDGVCISDGEPVIQAITRKMNLTDIPNLIISVKGRIRVPEQLERIQPCEICSPDFGLISLQDYLAPSIVLPIQTGRGCHWGKCSFCSHPSRSARRGIVPYSVRPMDGILEEIKQNVANGYLYYSFVDEALPVNRFKYLIEKLKPFGEKIRWTCYLRLEEGFDTKIFTAAYEAGLRKVFFGLETGSDRLLRLFKKGTNTVLAENVILSASKAGLSIHLFLMTEFPDETSQDLKETCGFLTRILPAVDEFGFTYDIFPLMADRGTELWCRPNDFGSSGLRFNKNNDMASRNDLRAKPGIKRVSSSRVTKAIGKTISSHLSKRCGIRHFPISHDSLHLLLIDVRQLTPPV